MAITITILIVFLLYAFQGVFAIFPYFLGVVFRFFYYPLEVIGQIIYPVGDFVYVLYTALALYTLFQIITSFFHLGGTKSGDDWPSIFN